jgi:hypothetical protein
MSDSSLRKIEEFSENTLVFRKFWYIYINNK